MVSGVFENGCQLLLVGAGLLRQLRFQGFDLCMCCLQLLLLLSAGFVTASANVSCCCCYSCCYQGARFNAAVCRNVASCRTFVTRAALLCLWGDIPIAAAAAAAEP
jgi:hypothetical protein